MSKATQLVIDVQFLQTGAYERGMGRYFVGLFMEMLKNLDDEGAVHCIYSRHLPQENIDAFKDELATAGRDKVRLEHLDLLTHDFGQDNYAAAYQHNAKAVDAFVAGLPEVAKRVWFIPSLMQEPAVPVLPSKGGFQTIILWHDLMPYLMHDHYFPARDTAHARSYLDRLTLLLDADSIVTNSATTRSDLITFMSIPPAKVTNIDGALNVQIIEQEPVLPTMAKQPFILCPASPEPNKNVLKALEAFEAFNKKHDEKYQLVVTSTYDSEAAKVAKVRKLNVAFTGHINFAELAGLYQECEALLFVSTYEGLGMPILEAVYYKKNIVCSDIPVFREIGGKESFYWADPHDAGDISRALEDAMKGTHDPVVVEKEYAEIGAKYSWKNSATTFGEVMRRGVVEKPPRQLIAVVGPHPNSFSSIGKFITETIPYLHETCDVHYYFDSGPSDERHGLIRFNYLQAYKHLYPVKELANRHGEYAKIIYHMGNSDHHMKTYLLAHAVPGTLVLHDTDLSGDGLSGQMRSNGYLSAERMQLERNLETSFLKKPERFITSMLSVQDRVITHSSFAHQVATEYSLGNQQQIASYHPMQQIDRPRPISNIDAPLRLGIAGIMTKVKGTDTIQWLYEQTNGLEGCHLTIFGFGFFADKDHLHRLSQEYPNIDVTFDLTDFAFAKVLGSMDLLINYRPVYKGEASRATLEALRERVVPVVRNIGWYGELPDDVAYKLDEIEELADLLSHLGKSPRSARQELEAKQQAGQDLLSASYGFGPYVNHLLGGKE